MVQTANDLCTLGVRMTSEADCYLEGVLRISCWTAAEILKEVLACTELNQSVTALDVCRALYRLGPKFDRAELADIL